MRPVFAGLDAMDLHVGNFELLGQRLERRLFLGAECALDLLHLGRVQLGSFVGILANEHVGIFQRVLNLRFVLHPFEIIGLVVFLHVIKVDDEVMFGTRLFIEVLGHESVEIIILAVGFPSDGDAGISLSESRPQDVAVVNFVLKADDASAV